MTLSYATKRVLVAGLLFGLVLWVPIHRFLVLRYDINPWKFCGFAMYTTAAPSVAVHFFTEAESGLVPLEVRVPDAEMREFWRFWENRRHAGKFERPDRLAEIIFANQAEVDNVSVVITRTVLDQDTAIFTSQRFGYRYLRDADGSQPGSQEP